MRKFFFTSLLLLSNLYGNEILESGIYTGLGVNIANFGGSATIENEYHSQTFDAKTSSSNFVIKVGYLNYNENRMEIYYKKNTIEAKDSSSSLDMSSSLVGFNYQWGISSMSSKNILPYIRVGIGYGSGEVENDNDFFALEVDLGAGIYYSINKDFDLSTGIYRRAIVFDPVNSYDNRTLTVALNGFEIAANYHF